jgi:hypothetical protein
MFSMRGSWPVAAVVLAGCPATDHAVTRPAPDDASSGGPSRVEAPGGGGGVTSTSSGDDGNASDEGTEDDDAGIGFVDLPDGGTATFGCDMMEGDCPAGEKCQLFDSRGGLSPDSTRCVPVARDPMDVDDACTFDVVEQVDDCDRGLLCWDPDPVTRVGVCKAYCLGPADAPSCADEMLTCNTNKDGPWVCLPACEPIAQDCPIGCACYAFADEFLCAPDASGDMGRALDPCGFVNACDPGLICLGASAFLDCTDGVGCCAPYCEVGDDDPCAELAGASCQPWFPEGMAPPGFETLGVCMVPA